MLTAVISLLIWLCVLALIFYLIKWVLGVLGVPVPQPVLNILMVIFVLIAILMIANTLLSIPGGLHMPLLR